jgi:hypothetical protein
MLTQTEIEELYKSEPYMDLGGAQNEWVEIGQPTRTLEEMRESEKRWKERHLRSDDVAKAKTERGAEYLSTLWKDAEPKDEPKAELTEDQIFEYAMFLIGERKQHAQVMPYEKAKRLFYDIYCACVKRTKDVVKVDEHLKLIFPNLVKWCIFDPSSEYDLKKGICLIGYPGVGKTYIMEALQIFTTAAQIESRQFDIVACDSLVLEYRKGKDIQVSKSMCYDDLGREPLSANSYGNIDNVMVSVIQNANKSWCDGIGTFHFTTNDTEKELENKYGTRAYSRLKQIVNFVILKGEDKR